ncbi:TPA: hypothetical protein N0F65_008271 [Lagenidium giganteum]|uniref:Integrase catalytic domain-containing protein n=1 Tax=Lagenidium giganteum TaxID=4803 RepID=A0AAV2YRV9_9STRA|nr:TPA: hypothetical protein N0F65_008271 [Lagenidium giganteum]
MGAVSSKPGCLLDREQETLLNTSEKKEGTSKSDNDGVAAGSEDKEQPHEGTLATFHVRLGHLRYDAVEKLARDPGSGIKLMDHLRPLCVACAEGKQGKTKKSKKDSGQNAPIDRVGGVICSDLKGPMTPRDRLGNRYMVNYVDHKSNYCQVFLARTKDAAAKHFRQFLLHFERQCNCTVRVLRTDGGGEYRAVDLFCEDVGIQRQKTEPNNSASNGKAERMHRTIVDKAWSMMFACGLPLIFWGDAVRYASYVLNRSPCPANEGGVSPIQLLTGTAPDVRGNVEFGSHCTVYQDPKGKTWAKRGVEDRIIGRSEEVKGFKVLVPSDQKLTVTRHVANIRTVTTEQSAHIERGLFREAKETVSLSDGKSDMDDILPRQDDNNKRVTRSQTKIKAQLAGVIKADPRTYKEAMASDEAEKWLKVIQLEIAALKANGTWKPVPRPPGVHALHAK